MQFDFRSNHWGYNPKIIYHDKSGVTIQGLSYHNKRNIRMFFTYNRLIALAAQARNLKADK